MELVSSSAPDHAAPARRHSDDGLLVLRNPPYASPIESTIWADRRWAVLVPHPDDETLGTGNLIAYASARERLAAVVFLTCGEASREHSTPGEAIRLAGQRKQEAGRALRRLTRGRQPEVAWLGWTDSRPHQPGGPAARRTAQRLAFALRRLRVDALAVTARNEPHCDHQAAWHLARNAVRLAGRAIGIWEYTVWADAPPRQAARRLLVRTATPALRNAALKAHQSQLHPPRASDFRLPNHLRSGGAVQYLYREKPPW